MLLLPATAAWALQAVLSWGQEAGTPWPSDLRGPLGLTPLHLAAAIPDPALAGPLLELLLSHCSGGPAAGAATWHSARTADGLTPQQFAGMAGTAGAAEDVLARLGVPGAAVEAGAEPGLEQGGAAGKATGEGAEDLAPNLSVQQPSTPRRCR